MSVIERRFISVPVELRVDSSGDEPAIMGYAAKYFRGDKRYESQTLAPGFRERLAPGCFKRALAKNPDIKCLVSHDPAKLLGRTSSGTCTVSADDTGLHYRCNPVDASYARDLMASIKRGDTSGSSFAFEVDPDDGGEDMWSNERDGNGDMYACRTIVHVSALHDVSPTSDPAYLATSCNARQLWPDGAPVSVRSHLSLDNEALNSFTRHQRRRMTNFILS